MVLNDESVRISKPVQIKSGGSCTVKNSPQSFLHPRDSRPTLVEAWAIRETPFGSKVAMVHSHKVIWNRAPLTH